MLDVLKNKMEILKQDTNHRLEIQSQLPYNIFRQEF